MCWVSRASTIEPNRQLEQMILIRMGYLKSDTPCLTSLTNTIRRCGTSKYYADLRIRSIHLPWSLSMRWNQNWGAPVLGSCSWENRKLMQTACYHRYPRIYANHADQSESSPLASSVVEISNPASQMYYWFEYKYEQTLPSQFHERDSRKNTKLSNTGLLFIRPAGKIISNLSYLSWHVVLRDTRCSRV